MKITEGMILAGALYGYGHIRSLTGSYTSLNLIIISQCTISALMGLYLVTAANPAIATPVSMVKKNDEENLMNGDADTNSS